ncbi:hypothetical protein GMORB2_6343 [Geosmithia morbida]|uniref:Uncharacterized protein n=1 Tax=Geosmithia morbida TaxID=1094350 RepID=A0A9P4YW60_9HYPO|nr:uncharacterized protein GMORB2_6343 [Geosmithia morbida]KAF4123642.1 hypothetical protein GMORB2_6343 [Geosmithia morbida]
MTPALPTSRLPLSSTTSRLNDMSCTAPDMGAYGTRAPVASLPGVITFLLIHLRDMLPTGRLSMPTRCHPPSNAPAEPAAWRRARTGSDGSMGGQPLLQTVWEDDSAVGHRPWSQSRTWVSQETLERASFRRLMQSLRYMGADKSPFIPRTPAALAAFRRAQYAEQRSHELCIEVDYMTASSDGGGSSSKRGMDGSGSSTTVAAGPRLLGSRRLDDFLSPFFAQETSFNRDRDHPSIMARWPALPELKEEWGKDKGGAAGRSRHLPLPRTDNFVEDEYNSGDWDEETGLRYLRPVASEVREEGGKDPQSDTALQVELDELSYALQALLLDIQDYRYQETEDDTACTRSSTGIIHD